MLTKLPTQRSLHYIHIEKTKVEIDNNKMQINGEQIKFIMEYIVGNKTSTLTKTISTLGN